MRAKVNPNARSAGVTVSSGCLQDCSDFLDSALDPTCAGFGEQAILRRHAETDSALLHSVDELSALIHHIGSRQGFVEEKGFSQKTSHPASTAARVSEMKIMWRTHIHDIRLFGVQHLLDVRIRPSSEIEQPFQLLRCHVIRFFRASDERTDIRAFHLPPICMMAADS